LKKLFEKRPYSNYLVKALKGHPKVAELYFRQIKSKAGSSTFDIANYFASSLEDLDEDLASLLSERQSFELLIAVLKAADWNSFGALGLKRTKFASVPYLKR